MELSPRFLAAFELAYELHAGQLRKGSSVPYLTHLMAVAALVGEYGGDEDQMIAALLHDAVEDQGGPVARERIQDIFGERVAALVDACTDADEIPKPPWQQRKEAYLGALAAAPHDARLIVAADKLHNVRMLIIDLRERGHELWQLFTGKREGSLWYYSEAVNALATDWDHAILGALADEVQLLHELDELVNEMEDQ
jgi:(p)ppGpp synthase/HD superfamily hydrolase